jgi:hypothetical protein
VSRQLAKVLRFGGDPTSIRRPVIEHHKRMTFIDGIFSEVSDSQIHVIETAPALCNDRTGYCYGVDGNTPLYRDYNHLTYEGAKRLRPILERVFLDI